MISRTILSFIRKNHTFLISTHVHPDPDALASAVALMHYLRSLGKQVDIVIIDAVPGMFLNIPGVRAVKKMPQAKRRYDVAIILDCGNLSRIGRVKELIGKKTKIVNIDHHITNDRFGNYNLVETGASSTAEVLYRLFKKARYPITKTVAELLYVGIVTDTGSFRYENTAAQTHTIVADLMRYGLSPHRIYKKLYETISLNDLQNFIALMQRIRITSSGKVVSIVLTKKTLKKFSGSCDVRDKAFTFLRSLKTVEVIAIFTQVSPTATRVNFRSQGATDVARLASLFNGGGHKKASGCLVKANLATAQKRVLAAIKKAMR